MARGIKRTALLALLVRSAADQDPQVAVTEALEALTAYLNDAEVMNVVRLILKLHGKKADEA